MISETNASLATSERARGVSALCLVRASALRPQCIHRKRSRPSNAAPPSPQTPPLPLQEFVAVNIPSAFLRGSSLNLDRWALLYSLCVQRAVHAFEATAPIHAPVHLSTYLGTCLGDHTETPAAHSRLLPPTASSEARAAGRGAAARDRPADCALTLTHACPKRAYLRLCVRTYVHT